MNVFRFVLGVSASLVSLTCSAETVEWSDGRWYDGDGFTRGTRYSDHGTLSTKRPAEVDRVVDLRGGYVVPALADAHHHAIDGANDLSAKVDTFLVHGIYYVKNPNVIPELLEGVRERLGVQDGIDVSFSNGGLTSTGGHPVGLHKMLAERGVFPGLKPEDMQGRAYFLIDDEADLDEQWPKIAAGRPDFIKTYLLLSGEGERSGKVRPGMVGLKPAMLSKIVERAHGAGLRVTTHIETAADFSHAVTAGVDEINHLPIPRREVSQDLTAYLIDEETARRAARQGVVVITTASTIARMMRHMPNSQEDLRAYTQNQIANFKILQQAGVKLAIGSDGISGELPMATAADEVAYLKEQGFADDATLLRLWALNTPKAVFPARMLGGLGEGYEADFIVVKSDPTEDIGRLDEIMLRVKDGKEITRKLAQPPSPTTDIDSPGIIQRR